ncbi:MAG: DUF2058 domain-containing protein [Nitrospira sp.]|nr:DUF2058 domain-containing protein [Nitrospira sp.]
MPSPDLPTCRASDAKAVPRPHRSKMTPHELVARRSQERRLATLKRKSHTLIFDEGQNTAICSCNGWEFTDRQHSLSPVHAKRQHDLHLEMVMSRPPETVLDVTPRRQQIGTFPDRLIRLRDRLLAEVKGHPTFSDLTDEERRSVVEHRLFSFTTKYPQWWGTEKRRPVSTGNGTLPEGLKRYHERQRQEKAERERRLNERLANPTS